MKTSIATVSINGTLKEKIQAIAKAGFDGRTLRHTVATMCDGGLLYSTFDDDHFEICADDVEEPVKIAAAGNNITQKIVEIRKSNDGSGRQYRGDTIGVKDFYDFQLI